MLQTISTGFTAGRSNLHAKGGKKEEKHMDNCEAKKDGGRFPDWSSFAYCKKCKRGRDHIEGKCSKCGTQREL